MPFKVPNQLHQEYKMGDFLASIYIATPEGGKLPDFPIFSMTWNVNYQEFVE